MDVAPPQLKFFADARKWINERMFVGAGTRLPDRVVMRFFELA